LGDKYLLTNETGNYIFLVENEFANFLAGKITSQDSNYQELKDKLFIKDKDYEISQFWLIGNVIAF